jgi:hypothetical protein
MISHRVSDAGAEDQAATEYWVQIDRPLQVKASQGTFLNRL